MRSFTNERMQFILNNTTYNSTYNTGLIIFYSMTLMTDIYAICRFIRFFNRQSEGGTSVFLAGALHTDTYRLFLEKWGASKVFDNHPKDIYDYRVDYTKMCKHVDFSKL